MEKNTKYIIGGVLIVIGLFVLYNSKKSKEQNISKELSSKSSDELKFMLYGLSRGEKAPTPEQEIIISKIQAILKLRGITDYNN
jgi:hypothetical protein